MNGITKETFKEADTDTKLDILFDYIKEIYEQKKVCGTRFEYLESKKLKDTALASSMGFVGGAAAVIAKMKFWG